MAATGSVWIKGIDDVWFKTTHAAGRLPVPAGWKPFNAIYVKSGANWTLAVNYDFTPPGVPGVQIIPSSTTSQSVVITAPGDADVVAMVLKRSKVRNPTSYAQDSEFDKTPTAPDSNFWSQFWMAPGQKRTRYFSYPANTTYYLTGWAYDSHGNYSAPVAVRGYVPIPPAPAPVRVHKAANFNAVDSRSFRTNQNAWRTDSNYVYQAGNDNAFGYWFYGNQIQALLAHATRVTNMQLYIQRVNSVHGTSSGASLMPSYHRMQNLNTGISPLSLTSNPAIQNGALGRGQGGWITIPSGYYEGFRTGFWAGFGLAAATTSFTDSRYLYAYGAGTSSGQLHIEFDEGN